MSTAPRLRGAYTALVTPFLPDGSLDEAAVVTLAERQIDLGIDGLVPVGTTGESPTTTHEEDDRIISLVIETVARKGLTGKLPVIAGTGSNDTATVIPATRRAKELGADAALVVAPYYNKPDQRMLEYHYTKVAEEGGLPIVVYNVPGRTGTNIEPATLMRIARHPNVIAVKEASGNIEQIMTILRDRPESLAVLSGDDSMTFPMLALGGDGIISVASNQIPDVMAKLCSLAFSGDWAEARALHNRYLELMRVNFISPNPVPVKAALAEMGLIHDVLRAPLLPMDEALRPRLRAALDAAGLLPATPVAVPA
ncbi:MAG: 4-hydroxy-tetrahydrodipicolinate synthase [Chloroflexota bacterium]